jgi:hypothetical protein
MRWLALLLFFITPALAEPAVTGNVLPALSEFSTSGSTTSSTISGCTAGQFCTGSAAAGGGTYTSTFDVPLTTAELRQGFTLNSSVTVDSHPSNAVLATCTSLTQIGDCRDVFRLTVSLFDGLDLAEKFEREVELDFSGLQNFTFQDTVGTNSFDVLLGEFSLFGIDAGFQSGFFGPKFSSPSLTISYQTVVEQQILDQIAQATEIVTASLAPPPPPPPTETVAASQTAGPPPPATTIATLETQAPPAPPPPPTIDPVATQAPEQQQQEEAAATAEVEAEIQAAEPEPQPEPGPGPEPQPESGPEPQPQPETREASPAREREQPAAPRQTRQQKVRAAAQKVVKKIAPSQRYSAASQTTTLVVMNLLSGKIATGPLIKDATAATFFSAANVPDGPSMIDPLTHYRVFGHAAGLHNTMVESQWIK